MPPGRPGVQCSADHPGPGSWMSTDPAPRRPRPGERLGGLVLGQRHAAGAGGHCPQAGIPARRDELGELGVVLTHTRITLQRPETLTSTQDLARSRSTVGGCALSQDCCAAREPGARRGPIGGKNHAHRGDSTCRRRSRQCKNTNPPQPTEVRLAFGRLQIPRHYERTPEPPGLQAAVGSEVATKPNRRLRRAYFAASPVAGRHVAAGASHHHDARQAVCWLRSPGGSHSTVVRWTRRFGSKRSTAAHSFGQGVTFSVVAFTTSPA